jgi:hypothetical protein
MMTVNYKDPDNCEHVFAVLDARYDPRSCGSEAGRTPTMGTVSFSYPRRDRSGQPGDGDLVQVSCGEVRLMNDAGKTVAKWDLGGWRAAEDCHAPRPVAYTTPRI